MENQLIGKIKIKYLPKRLNNTRERQRESKKKSEAKQEKARRNATKQQQQLKAFSSGCSRCSFAVFQQFSTFFPHIISKRRRPSFILWPVHESARRTQSAHIGRQQTHVQTLYSNSGGVSAPLSHLPLSYNSLQCFPLVLCF